jgi:hypothetical protein
VCLFRANSYQFDIGPARSGLARARKIHHDDAVTVRCARTPSHTECQWPGARGRHGLAAASAARSGFKSTPASAVTPLRRDSESHTSQPPGRCSHGDGMVCVCVRENVNVASHAARDVCLRRYNNLILSARRPVPGTRVRRKPETFFLDLIKRVETDRYRVLKHAHSVAHVYDAIVSESAFLCRCHKNS